MTRRPLFLARKRYRRRRLEDAARIVPLVAAGLLLAPVLLTPEIVTSRAMSYVFAVWAVLIVTAALLARALRGEPEDEE